MPLERLVEIMRRLRDPVSGCEWDTVQTFDTIAPYTIEEAYEVADAIARGDMADLKDELGDLLFAVVNLCRKAGVHPALALDRANVKFARRFRRVEEIAREREIAVGSASLEELDRIWDEVKAGE